MKDELREKIICVCGNHLTTRQSSHKMFLIHLLLLTLVVNSHEYHRELVDNPEIGLTTMEIVERQNYPIEEYENIKTSDGYLLSLHRMPHGKTADCQSNKRPIVFLMHGLMCCSGVWVNMGPAKGLAYLLVDAGYDVWMGNARGNMYSRKHISYDPDKDPIYWKFSWHEIGTIDLPTMIDFVLNTTGQEKLYYIGHSQGTTTFFVMASELPEYNKKIILMVALAPIAFMSHMNNNLVKFLAYRYPALFEIAGLAEFSEFFSSEYLREFLNKSKLCHDDSVFQELCANVLFLICGWNSEQLNRTMISVLTSSAPAGSSSMQFVHYAQEIISGRFSKYNFEPTENKRIYGSSISPSYNLALITAPVALLHSHNDLLVGHKDVKKLAKRLPNIVSNYLVPDKKFNHLDFIFANDVKSFIYDFVLQLLKKF